MCGISRIGKLILFGDSFIRDFDYLKVVRIQHIISLDKTLVPFAQRIVSVYIQAARTDRLKSRSAQV